MATERDMSKISIKIVNEKMWKEFCALSTEMVLTKNGRKLFPRLQYKVSGLEAKKRYLVELRFQLADNKKYKFKEGGWVPTECFEPNIAPQKVIHPDGWQNGDVWMQCGIKFDRVKITNNSEDSRGNVLLQSMRKYQPVITVYTSETFIERVNSFCVPQERLVKVFEFSSRIQEFIAVTAYQNNGITALKITNNPYAKGFRDGQNKRKRSLSSTGSTPSPDFKRTSDFDNTPALYSPNIDFQFPLRTYQHPSIYPQSTCSQFEVPVASQFVYQQPSFGRQYCYQTNMINYDSWPCANMWNSNFVSPSPSFTNSNFSNQSTSQT